MKEYCEYMDGVTADTSLYDKIMQKAINKQNIKIETQPQRNPMQINPVQKRPIRRAVMAAVVIIASLSLTATAYAVVTQIINRSDAGDGYVYVESDEHFLEYPDDAWKEFESGVIEIYRPDGEVIVEHYDHRYKEIPGNSLEDAFKFIGSEFKIPESFGLSVSSISLRHDQYLGINTATIILDCDNGNRSEWVHISHYNTFFDVSTLTDDEDYRITVGLPGSIEELNINGVIVHRIIINGESLFGLEDMKHRNYITMIWQYNNLVYRIWSDDFAWTPETLETLVADMLS